MTTQRKIHWLLEFVNLFFFLSSFLKATSEAYGSSQGRGGIGTAAAGRSKGSEAHLWPTSQLMATPDGSLTHWVRSRMEPVSLGILVGFITAEPQWEFPQTF